MSKSPKFAVVGTIISVGAVAVIVALASSAVNRAEERNAAEAAKIRAERAALAADQEASAPAVAPAVEEAKAEAPAPVVETAQADTSVHGHGEAGTAPIASIIAGAAVAQSVDSPAIDATGVMYGLGREALPEEIASWDIDVRPDGLGLPEGKGDVWTGEEVFIENCAVCHGDFAEGVDRWPVLAGGQDSLTDDRPVKTIGSYWPYLSTVWDYVNRAMPFGNAQSLTPDEVYAITAYLMYSNDLVDDDFELSRDNFLEVRLPNEENFYMDDRAIENGELAAFAGEVCMTDCKESVEIVARAAIIDVTPEDAEAREANEAAAAEAETAPAVEVAAVEAEGEAEVVEAAAGIDPELVAQGEKAFKKCAACHAVGAGAKSKTGPHLNALFGRTAGGIDGFKYSKPMANKGAEGLTWTEETLAEFLTKPRDYIKGTKMSFAGFKKDTDTAAVIAYLQTFQ